MTRTMRAVRAAWVAGALLAAPALTGSAFAQDESYDAGSNWLTLRAGYAKSTVDGSGDGGAGYAFGYSRMIKPLKLYKWSLFKHYSLGSFVQYDVVGRFGRATEIVAPASIELVRHYQWKTALKPYVGIGVAAFYHKLYRTGDDDRSMDLGGYLTFGGHAPFSPTRLIGLDFRVARVNTQLDRPNPVFGAGHTKAGIWSAKIGYSVTY